MARPAFSPQPKPVRKPKRPRKALPRRRGKQRRRPEGTYDERHRAIVQMLPCCSCGAQPPSEADHAGKGGRRNCRDDETIPLCHFCHRERTDGKLLLPHPDGAGRVFRYVTQATMRAFCAKTIVETRWLVDMAKSSGTDFAARLAPGYLPRKLAV